MRFKIFLLFSIFLLGCSEDYTPKPRAFFKIDLPQKDYLKTVIDCPFEFNAPSYSDLVEVNKNCFYNLEFTHQNAILHLTYLPLEENLQEHTEESRNLAYKHDIMADAIAEQVYINDSLKVYGILYDYDGMSATAAQFYLTDSVSHFFRGALYFNTEISDSLLPVNNFLKEDVKHIIESFSWINQ
jgi:gliding motility-associated lipoprotein GldD